MANVVNYAELFSAQLDQKYVVESKTNGIAGVTLPFAGTNVVKLPTIATPGFKNHVRTGGWNKGDVENTWQPYKLEFDRDIQFFVDAEDVDETNMVLSAANITNNFETEQAIPEFDAYTISTIYERVTSAATGVATKTFEVLDGFADKDKTVATVRKFNIKLQAMQDKGVDISRLQIRGNASVIAFLNAIKSGTQVFVDVDATEIAVLKGLLMQIPTEFVTVPANRLKTAYDYTTGFKPATGAKDIAVMITDPQAIARPMKRTKIYLKGVDAANNDGDEGDGYTYRQRKYFDVFVLKNKVDGVEFFMSN